MQLALCVHLGLTTVCAALASWLVNTERTLQREPFSVASTASPVQRKIADIAYKRGEITQSPVTGYLLKVGWWGMPHEMKISE
jgi:hypothetical protein